jgi:hypothetical protein
VAPQQPQHSRAVETLPVTVIAKAHAFSI